jgi:hypothetical protein
LEECEKRIEECLYDDWFKDIELNAVEKGYLDNFNDWNDWNIQTLPSYDRPPTIKWD